jgi:hypothetical protein
VRGLAAAQAFGTPTSTFVFTAVFTAGLAIDARAKKRRNEQWDTAFTVLRKEMARDKNVEEELGTGNVDADAQVDVPEEEGIQSNKSHLMLEEVFSEDTNWDALQQTIGNELLEGQPFPLHSSPVSLAHTDDLWELLSSDSRFPGTQAIHFSANTGQNLVRHHLPPQSLWSYDHAREKSLRRRQVRKKLAIQELSMGMLISSLLLRARSFSASAEIFEDLSPSLQDVAVYEVEESAVERLEARKSLKALESLPSDSPDTVIWALLAGRPSFTKPNYSQDSDGDFYHVCAAMNASIKRLFSTGQTEPARTLAKIAHNLFISTAAPDVQTFNVLISGFKRWKLSGLIDEAIAALDSCKIRPNEITCATILDHYIQAKEPEKFSRFVAKMRGVGDALMLAMPSININETGAARLVRVSDSKVYQKVYPTPLVFNTLMLGVLRFAGIDRALEIYYEMKEDGWGLDVLGLSHFLIECVYRSDWDNGLYIWEEINSIKRRTKDSHMEKAYAEMLSLCSVTGNTAAFNHILRDVVKRGMDRKEILDSTTAITRRARAHHTRSKQDENVTVAPAWAADNVLIAVSGYMDESNNSRPSSVTELEAELEGIASSYEDPLPYSGLEESKKVDPTAAWSTWMEHEFGTDPAPSPAPNAHQPTELPNLSSTFAGRTEFSHNLDRLGSVVRKVVTDFPAQDEQTWKRPGPVRDQVSSNKLRKDDTESLELGIHDEGEFGFLKSTDEEKKKT